MIRRFAARPAPVLLDPDHTRAELTRLLWSAGLGRVADDLVGRGREGLRILGGWDARHPARHTFLGGEPELPDDVDWPVYRGRPQHFLAQIDLTEVHAALPGAPLPAAGRLLFFRHSVTGAWSEHQVHGVDAAAIVFVPPGRPTTLRPAPTRRPFRMYAVELRRELTYPPDFAEQIEAAAEAAGLFQTVDGGELDNLLHHVDDLAARTAAAPSNRLLGHATAVQHDPVAPGSSLLLQLDAFDDGVATRLLPSHSRMYWWLRDTDLGAGRWPRALWEEQCA